MTKINAQVTLVVNYELPIQWNQVNMERGVASTPSRRLGVMVRFEGKK